MNGSMPRKLPLYVVKERTRHGKVIFYFRIGKGERTRLNGVPGTAEFNKAYQAAMKGERFEKDEGPKAAPKSVRWLIERYMESSAWAAYSTATRKQHGLFFKQVIEKAGNEDYRNITRKSIMNALEDRKGTPALANNFLKAMKGLFKWALRNEMVREDPTANVDRLKHKTKGFPVWTASDVEAFCEHWPVGTMPRLAFELLVHSGIRRSDVFRAGRQHLSGNVFSMVTEKTKAAITVELPPRVMEAIAATKRSGLHFLESSLGKPFTSKESFGNWFGDCCRKAGVEKSAHGLRKLSATLAANGGATTHELMAQYGWSNVQQAEVYTRGADRARLGVKSSRVVAEQLEAIKPRTAAPNQIPPNRKQVEISKKKT